MRWPGVTKYRTGESHRRVMRWNSTMSSSGGLRWPPDLMILSRCRHRKPPHGLHPNPTNRSPRPTVHVRKRPNPIRSRRLWSMALFGRPISLILTFLDRRRQGIAALQIAKSSNTPLPLFPEERNHSRQFALRMRIVRIALGRPPWYRRDSRKTLQLKDPGPGRQTGGCWKRVFGST